jgi:hypothetical protein
MTAPTLLINGQTITTSWTAGTNNGDAITAYSILYQYSNGSFIANTALCNGGDSTVIAALACSTNMTLFTSIPVSLTAGTQIVAEIQAMNSKGWSGLSSPSTSAVYAM